MIHTLHRAEVESSPQMGRVGVARVAGRAGRVGRGAIWPSQHL